MKVSFTFEWRDCWVGIYIPPKKGNTQTVWVLPLPCCAIRIEIYDD